MEKIAEQIRMIYNLEVIEFSDKHIRVTDGNIKLDMWKKTYWVVGSKEKGKKYTNFEIPILETFFGGLARKLY